MNYLIVPEGEILELFRLPKRTIIERLIRILQTCDSCTEDAASDSGDSDATRCDASGETESDTGMESDECDSRPLSANSNVADVGSKNNSVGTQE